MHYFPRFPRAVQLHMLKCLSLSEQCAFGRASTECTRLFADATRLREEITVPGVRGESVRAGIAALAVGGEAFEAPQRQLRIPSRVHWCNPRTLPELPPFGACDGEVLGTHSTISTILGLYLCMLKIHVDLLNCPPSTREISAVQPFLWSVFY